MEYFNRVFKRMCRLLDYWSEQWTFWRSMLVDVTHYRRCQWRRGRGPRGNCLQAPLQSFTLSGIFFPKIVFQQHRIWLGLEILIWGNLGTKLKFWARIIKAVDFRGNREFHEFVHVPRIWPFFTTFRLICRHILLCMRKNGNWLISGYNSDIAVPRSDPDYIQKRDILPT